MAGPAAAIATLLPTKSPAPMTPPRLISATCRRANVCGSRCGADSADAHGLSRGDVAGELTEISVQQMKEEQRFAAFHPALARARANCTYQSRLAGLARESRFTT